MIAFLEAGAEVIMGRNDGVTPMLFAAHNGQVAVIEALLRAGEMVDKVDGRIGFTPLMSAAEMGHDVAVSMLLAAGADVEHTTDDGRTALKLATRLPMNEDGHKRTVALLRRDLIR